MSLIVFLFVIGAILLALEVVVPGAVLGIIGGISMLVGVIVAFDQFGFQGGAVAATVRSHWSQSRCIWNLCCCRNHGWRKYFR